MKKHIRYIPAILAVAVLLGSCTNILAPPEVREAVPAGKGRITIQLGDSARTALPGDLSFDKYVLRFMYTDTGTEIYTHGDEEWSDGVSVDLEPGEWTVYADAYFDGVVSGTGSAVVTVNSGVDSTIKIPIGPKTDDPNIKGTLKYTVRYPPPDAFAPSPYDEPKLYVYDMAGDSNETEYNITTNGGEETELLPAGVYRVRAVVKNTIANTTASAATVAHIYGNKTTSVEFTFRAADFTSSIPLAGTANLTVPNGVIVTRRTVGVYVIDSRSIPIRRDEANIRSDEDSADFTLLIPSTDATADIVFVRQDIAVDDVAYEGDWQHVTITNPIQPVTGLTLSERYYKVVIDPSIDSGTVKATSMETSVEDVGISIAREGTEVTLTVTPPNDKILRPGSIKVSGEDSESLPIDNNSFTMPGEPVTVSAEFISTSPIRYVKTGGTGDGATWENASGDLQKMIDELGILSSASDTPSETYVVKLGAGIYNPQWKPVIPAPDTSTDYESGGRNAAFILREGVQVWGGYDGIGNNIDEAPWNGHFNPDGTAKSGYETILSGDFNDDDVVGEDGGVLTFTDNDENAYHVVLAVNIPATSGTVLNGLTINGGNADTDDGILTVGDYSIPQNSGGGMYNNNSSPELTNVTISGNAALSQGGGIYAVASSLTMTGGAITGNATTNGFGGGVSVESGTFTMDNVTVSGNTADSHGGGVYFTGTTFTVNGGTISGNTTNGYGGGVYFYSGGDFIMEGGTIIGGEAPSDANIALDGGGVFFDGYGVEYDHSGDFTMRGGSISGNNAIAPDAYSGNGGGVYVTGGTFEITGGTISNNRATTNGGGVYITGSGTTFKMSGSTANISGNNATSTDPSYGNGGGVYVSYGTFIMEGGTIGGSVADANTAENGGGVYITGSGTSFTMSGNAKISGNTATNTVTTSANGGGVYVAAGSFEMSETAQINSNNATGATNSAARGGGVYVANDGSFAMSEGASISNNTTNGNGNNSDGGGVYFAGTSFTMSGTAKISGNNPTVSTNGGGVCVAAGTFEMSDAAEISGSRASNGGGVYVFDGGAFTMTGGTISGHSANFGGGVYVFDGGAFTMTGGTIGGTGTNANTTSSGGGVYVQNGEFTMDGGTISGNKATSSDSTYGYGGGVYFNSNGKTFTMSGNAQISGNTATGSGSGHGGGVYVNAGTFTKTGGTIYGNVKVDGSAENPALQNSASSGSGHAVYIFDDSTPLTRNITADTDVDLDSGEPTILGGWEFFTFSGIQDAITSLNNTNGGTLTLPGGTIYNMTGSLSVNQNITITTEPGAEVVLKRQSGFTSDMFLVTGGKLTLRAEDTEGGGSLTLEGGGGGVNNVAGSLVKVESGDLTIQDGVTLSNNKNFSANGGGVYFSGGTFLMEGGTIKDNSVGTGTSGFGGGVYFSGTTFTMSGGIISDNTTPGYGGGVTVYNGEFNMSGGEIKDNQATSSNSCGGGVYVNSEKTFRKTGGTITNNTAPATQGRMVYYSVNTAAYYCDTILDSTTSGNISTEPGNLPSQPGEANSNGTNWIMK
jgi:hypothetical protein